LAVHNVHDVTNRYPKSYGTGTLSWQYQILAYIDQGNVINLTPFYYNVANKVIPVFVCPSDPNNGGRVYGGNQYALTSYLCNTGRNFNDWSTGGDTGVMNLYPTNPGVKMTTITDGTSNTLMIGERPPQGGTNDMYYGWWVYIDYDAAMWAINPGTGPYSTEYTGTPCPNPAIFSKGDPKNRCDVNHWYSMHPGGGNFAMCDGTVRFFTYDAGTTLIPQLATRAGNEVVTVPN
jgi:prepilin-type processing-associated H-X9-DG protein